MAVKTVLDKIMLYKREELPRRKRDVKESDLRAALHHALRPGSNLELLCAAVHRLLVVHGEVGRNDPCPCGSGQKYKKCCG